MKGQAKRDAEIAIAVVNGEAPAAMAVRLGLTEAAIKRIADKTIRAAYRCGPTDPFLEQMRLHTLKNLTPFKRGVLVSAVISWRADQEKDVA